MPSPQKRANEADDVHEMFDAQSGDCYDERLKEIEKEVRALFVLFFGFLAGHFIGLLLF